MVSKFFGGLTNVSRLAAGEQHRIGWRWRETAVACRSIFCAPAESL